MNLHPFMEVVENAQKQIQKGATVYQQFECQHCHQKQTMDEPNRFYTQGLCEECGGLTDIQANGQNFMAVWAKNAHTNPSIPKGGPDVPLVDPAPDQAE